jgi:hypothetical protein
MSNRSLKRRIASLRLRITEHELKVEQEKSTPRPDHGLITHWQVEIEAFCSSLERALKRLG